MYFYFIWKLCSGILVNIAELKRNVTATGILKTSCVSSGELFLIIKQIPTRWFAIPLYKFIILHYLQQMRTTQLMTPFPLMMMWMKMLVHVQKSSNRKRLMRNLLSHWNLEVTKCHWFHLIYFTHKFWLKSFYSLLLCLVVHNLFNRYCSFGYWCWLW